MPLPRKARWHRARGLWLKALLSSRVAEHVGDQWTPAELTTAGAAPDEGCFKDEQR